MRIHIFWYQWKATGRRPQYQAWKRTGHTERRSLEGNWKHSIWFQQHWGTSPGKDFLPGNCVSNLTIASGSCWQWVLFVFIFLVCTVFLLIINIIRIKIKKVLSLQTKKTQIHWNKFWILFHLKRYACIFTMLNKNLHVGSRNFMKCKIVFVTGDTRGLDLWSCT